MIFIYKVFKIIFTQQITDFYLLRGVVQVVIENKFKFGTVAIFHKCPLSNDDRKYNNSSFNYVWAVRKMTEIVF